LFEEAFEKKIADREHYMEFQTALLHSDMFVGMLDAAHDRNTSMVQLLVDSVRIGWHAGRIGAGVDELEKMIGL
jgi:hypothetical protein